MDEGNRPRDSTGQNYGNSAFYQGKDQAANADLYDILFHGKGPESIGSIPQEFAARGTWTQQEDEQLVAAIQHLGAKKWRDIARFVPTRTSKQCRERWYHRLDPSIRHDPFEPWEDQVIINTQREVGNKWSFIANKLPGRSGSGIKNRWYSGLRNSSEPSGQIDISSIIPSNTEGGMGFGNEGSGMMN